MLKKLLNKLGWFLIRLSNKTFHIPFFGKRIENKKWLTFVEKVLDFKNIVFYRNKNKSTLKEHAIEASKIYIKDRIDK